MAEITILTREQAESLKSQPVTVSVVFPKLLGAIEQFGTDESGKVLPGAIGASFLLQVGKEIIEIPDVTNAYLRYLKDKTANVPIL